MPDDLAAIVTGDPVTVPAESTYEPPELANYGSNKTTFSAPDGHNYIRIEGTLRAEDGSTVTVYDYFATDAHGNRTGNILQRDYSDGNGKIIREYYDDAHSGVSGKRYEINESLYNMTPTLRNSINRGTDAGTPTNYANSSVGASNGSLTLTYKDENGQDVTYTLTNRRSDSTYATTVSANPFNKLDELQNAVNNATAAKDAALKELEKLFDSKESKIMDYFDSVFKMIAENGWVYDENVNSDDKEESQNYLNAMLQNNMYFVTEVDTLDGTDFNYATKLATNVSKIFEVYDEDAQNQALSKYEAEKAEISSKEKQVDIRMNKLETEQDAIKTELDSLKKIIDDNVQATFKIFT